MGSSGDVAAVAHTGVDWDEVLRGDGPPCEIVRRPGWEGLCTDVGHPAQFVSVKSCGCRTLICQMALNRIISSLVHDVGLECQRCHELPVSIADWYPL
jgi:hypothetical protein